ncbi:hypothetical protein [Gemella morbillorum]|uniref:hypothetical protein n=1 Tax=Gemella morbillorum TaxID=29391 RepID=UPI00319E2D9C
MQIEELKKEIKEELNKKYIEGKENEKKKENEKTVVISQEEFKKMRYIDRLNLKHEKPEIYKQLVNGGIK